MHRDLAPALAFGLALGALLTGCPGLETAGGDDLRPVPDLRTGPGNTLIGAVCDETRPCLPDPKGTGPARCATVSNFDAVGACAPACDGDGDCDTALPGKAFCTIMTGMMTAGKKECVLFCDSDRKIDGRECPAEWTCVSEQMFRICRPPQTKPM